MDLVFVKLGTCRCLRCATVSALKSDMMVRKRKIVWRDSTEVHHHSLNKFSMSFSNLVCSDRYSLPVAGPAKPVWTARI